MRHRVNHNKFRSPLEPLPVDPIMEKRRQVTSAAIKAAHVKGEREEKSAEVLRLAKLLLMSGPHSTKDIADQLHISYNEAA